jgi:hypothetical protein
LNSPRRVGSWRRSSRPENDSGDLSGSWVGEVGKRDPLAQSTLVVPSLRCSACRQRGRRGAI